MSADGHSHDQPPAAASLEHLTGPSRGRVSWLAASALDVSLGADRLIHVAEAAPGPPGAEVVARLHRSGETYEVESLGPDPIWVNRTPVKSHRLGHGDMIEFCERGPMSRYRLHDGVQAEKRTAGEILSDAIAYLRSSRRPAASRLWSAFCAVIRRLAGETTLMFRVTALLAIFVLTFMVYQQSRLNSLLAARVAGDAVRLEALSTALRRANDEALTPGDLQQLRSEFARELTTASERLSSLERLSVASALVFAEASPSVAFLQGAYGFRETSSGRMLRHMRDEDGDPVLSATGTPKISLDGDGPIAERQFTGTGFVIGDSHALVTNRHVALPWEHDESASTLAGAGLEPVMVKFIAWWPGVDQSEPVELALASSEADLAILHPTARSTAIFGLPLAEAAPAPGDEVVLIGYPTGLRTLLAQAGDAFVAELQAAVDADFWMVARRLAAAGHIAPLANRGIVGQVSAETVVYDAQTTSGGSGGPVLDTSGAVVAVNAAILRDFGGSNIGVPAARLRALLESAQLAASN